MTSGNHHWNYKGKDIEQELNLNEYVGFVYCVSNLQDGRRYFGRKQFWNKGILYRKTKAGRRKRVHTWTESDWRDYRGSSEGLSADIDKLGAHNFSFDILSPFQSKSGLALGEATIILSSGSLLAPERFYNRAAPAVRGRISLPDSDTEEVKYLLNWIKDNP